ncbi:A24 family peptidase [Lichenicoccus roseus]|uniref:Prepilin peptidase n=1 Tax=Lichenicoccus roseus TaxID=2683649 RepID=A0A5R9J6W2_9PROT|nr:A24 family peptidase [Lichenicoccus roseus]TLU72709.1 prepilin peptidase [Lichenicoccus roseus]
MIPCVCVLLLAYAALHDVVGRTIPNGVPASLAALGCLRAALAHTIAPSLWIATMIFLAATLAWRKGLLGGGDVKLLAAISLVVTPHEVPVLLISISMVGGMLAILYVFAGKVLPQPQPVRPRHLVRRAIRAELWRVHRRGPLPYAVAIALGTMTQIVGH